LVLCLSAAFFNAPVSLGSPPFYRANDRVVKESGLVCFTYGQENDDKLFVRKQIEAGVDAVIVDSVLAINNDLTSGGIQSNRIQNGNGL
jgi:glycerophosphoryl diester phosphodiesterase